MSAITRLNATPLVRPSVVTTEPKAPAKPAPKAVTPAKPVQAQAMSPGAKAFGHLVGVVAGGAAGLVGGGMLGAVGSTLVGAMFGLGEGYLAYGMLAMGGWAVIGAVAGAWGVHALIKRNAG